MAKRLSKIVYKAGLNMNAQDPRSIGLPRSRWLLIDETAEVLGLTSRNHIFAQAVDEWFANHAAEIESAKARAA